MVNRRTLREYATKGRFRRVASISFDALVSGQLGYERARDRLWRKGLTQTTESVPLLSNLTLLVKTFERPATLRRLLRGIRHFYPDLTLIVVDDSRKPVKLDGVEHVLLPFDSGVSAGRAAGLKLVRTKYVMILDDDFIFYRHTRLAPALAIMEREPAIDIMGGQVINLPFRRTTDYSTAPIFPTEARSLYPPGSTIAGLPVYDKVANFFIARTERLRLVGWGSQLKRLDHADFFTRARGVLATVYNSDLRCLHAQTPFDTTYMAFRTDTDGDSTALKNRYYASADSIQ